MGDTLRPGRLYRFGSDKSLRRHTVSCAGLAHLPPGTLDQGHNAAISRGQVAPTAMRARGQETVQLTCCLTDLDDRPNRWPD